MITVKMPDKYLGKVFRVSVGCLESIDVIVRDETAIEIEELVELLVHKVDIPRLYYLSEIPYYWKTAYRLPV